MESRLSGTYKVRLRIGADLLRTQSGLEDDHLTYDGDHRLTLETHCHLRYVSGLLNTVDSPSGVRTQVSIDENFLHGHQDELR